MRGALGEYVHECAELMARTATIINSEERLAIKHRKLVKDNPTAPHSVRPRRRVDR